MNDNLNTPSGALSDVALEPLSRKIIKDNNLYLFGNCYPH